MPDLDYTNYFWAGERVRLRGLTEDDAVTAFANTLDSPGRRVLQLGIELPTSVEALRVELGKRANCKDVDGVIIFAIEDHAGTYVGGVSIVTPVKPPVGSEVILSNERAVVVRHLDEGIAVEFVNQRLEADEAFKRIADAIIRKDERR